MNTVTQGSLLLMKSAITGEAYALPSGLDLEQVYRTMARHSILPLGYLGARNSGVEKGSPVMQKFLLAYGKSLQISETQLGAVRRLCRAFDEAGVDYMPVKGCNLKSRYPYPELRLMGDADILIRMEQYDRIRGIMEALGYSEGLESNHELVWNSPELQVELHKRLISTDHRAFSRYYGDGWKLAARREGTHFYMKPEDEFIYIFTHMAKHYRQGGVGFRQVLDLWVLERSQPALDRAYIGAELEKLQLRRFYENICRTLEVWFGDRQPDAVTELITDYIDHSGSWGSMEKHEISFAVTGTAPGEGRLLWILRNTFPSVDRISINYPIARKYPALLPGIWVWRWIDVILTRPEKLREKYRTARKLTDKNLTDFQRALQAVGLEPGPEEKGTAER